MSKRKNAGKPARPNLISMSRARGLSGGSSNSLEGVRPPSDSSVSPLSGSSNPRFLKKSSSYGSVPQDSSVVRPLAPSPITRHKIHPMMVESCCEAFVGAGDKYRKMSGSSAGGDSDDEGEDADDCNVSTLKKTVGLAKSKDQGTHLPLQQTPAGVDSDRSSTSDETHTNNDPTTNNSGKHSTITKVFDDPEV